jgi:hypothetical protein
MVDGRTGRQRVEGPPVERLWEELVRATSEDKSFLAVVWVFPTTFLDSTIWDRV